MENLLREAIYYKTPLATLCCLSFTVSARISFMHRHGANSTLFKYLFMGCRRSVKSGQYFAAKHVTILPLSLPLQQTLDMSVTMFMPLKTF